MNRRRFLRKVLSASAYCASGSFVSAKITPAGEASIDPNSALIREGAQQALEKTINRALLERVYPGHFMVTADGGYGMENTWPGLDSWQMAGAYLLTGRRRVALDYFDFVEASQREDGNIPFAIFPGGQSPGSTDSWLRGLRYPNDVYSYEPAWRPGQAAHSAHDRREWIGLFAHWQINANPLTVLGPISCVLTARDIADSGIDREWIRQKMPGLDAAGNYVWSRRNRNGLISGGGFYTETPPRNQWDGVTQCYAVHAFRALGALHRMLGARHRRDAELWESRAEKLAERFEAVFWQKDHYAEYLHPTHGLVDSHGLSDVNWAAIGLGVTGESRARKLFDRLVSEQNFWRGDMPTHSVTEPNNYASWEFSEPLPFPFSSYTKDVAAMGRVWHLEVLACQRMRAFARLRESVVKVCQAGKAKDWCWFERYHAAPDNTVVPQGHGWYCEYPAILIRTLLNNPQVFPETASLREVG